MFKSLEPIHKTLSHFDATLKKNHRHANATSNNLLSRIHNFNHAQSC